MSRLDPRAQAVLEYWFGDLDQTSEYFEERNSLWFGGTAEIDEYIHANFAKDLELAALGKLTEWEKSPKGSLALIVLLDQFSLNIHREKPKSYLQSAMAIPIAERAIERGWEFVLTPAERIFLYLPFEHGESLAHQERSITLFKTLTGQGPPALREMMDFYLDFARRHHRVVAKYGRFPDRNEVFGRESSLAEKEFLASDEAPF